jgi:hypothetical protein
MPLSPDQPAVKSELIIAKRRGPIQEVDQGITICGGRERVTTLRAVISCA